MAKYDYLERICDVELQEALTVMGAVLIEGAKWCGKTSTAGHIARSTLYMQDPDHARSYQEMADTKPSLLLQGNTPRLIDEWQMSPVLWDGGRYDRAVARWSLGRDRGETWEQTDRRGGSQSAETERKDQHRKDVRAVIPAHIDRWTICISPKGQRVGCADRLSKKLMCLLVYLQIIK
ncbi:hypothetical protein AGMMS49574_25500 [Bacteroidia bacterium]|nr:hypothetical protein AGMMS49574_25500 [Bacteroidia bacterium]